MAYVYILEGLKSGKFYIGSTENLTQRLRHHKKGSTPTTKRFGGTRLVLKQNYMLLKDARAVERKLKKLKRKSYIRKIIQDGYIKLVP